MLAAPFASLFLILALLSCASLESSVGLQMLNPIPAQTRPVECWEEGYVVLSVLKDGAAAINGIRITKSQLFSQLRSRFQTRTQWILFVEADPTITVSEVVTVLDTCQKTLPDVRIAFYPKSLQVEQWCPWFPSRSRRQQRGL
jgi:biopolymer transport protein ExbD